MAYKAEIDPPADDTRCECGGCAWTGTFADVNEIGDCVLTPGHPSPAGRCPDCGALAYVDTEETRINEAAPDLFKALAALLPPHGLLSGWANVGPDEAGYEDVRAATAAIAKARQGRK